jgi:hypothetical protein
MPSTNLLDFPYGIYHSSYMSGTSQHSLFPNRNNTGRYEWWSSSWCNLRSFSYLIPVRSKYFNRQFVMKHFPFMFAPYFKRPRFVVAVCREATGMGIDFVWVPKFQGNSNVARRRIRRLSMWRYMCCSTSILEVCNSARPLQFLCFNCVTRRQLACV